LRQAQHRFLQADEPPNSELDAEIAAQRGLKSGAPPTKL
jgi:hypothetical protein